MRAPSAYNPKMIWAALLWSAAPCVAQAPLPTGTLTPFVVFDSAYHRPRQIWVYTPPGYTAHPATPYPLLLAFDGAEYRDTMPLPAVLDTLVATRKAPPLVAVLIDDSAFAVRIADLGNASAMVRFLGQLVPWVRSRWPVTTDPHRVIVTGSSAGGLAAAYVAFARPDLFGNVWSQSGAFWRGAEASNGPPYEWLTAQVHAAPRKDVMFVLDVGALEDHATLGGAGPNFLQASRRFHDALAAKGYDVTYTEVPNFNHASQWWRQRLSHGIATITAGWTSADPTTGYLGLADPYHAAPRDTVSPALYDGWKQYVLLCERCHGEDARGTSFAPSLVASLRSDGSIPTADAFMALMRSGRIAKGMPAAAILGLDSTYFAGLYQYLKGRSDGVLHGGRPARRE